MNKTQAFRLGYKAGLKYYDSQIENQRAKITKMIAEYASLGKHMPAKYLNKELLLQTLNYIILQLKVVEDDIATIQPKNTAAPKILQQITESVQSDISEVENIDLLTTNDLKTISNTMGVIAIRLRTVHESLNHFSYSQ